jgi:hypothetical protein
MMYLIWFMVCEGSYFDERRINLFATDSKDRAIEYRYKFNRIFGQLHRDFHNPPKLIKIRGKLYDYLDIGECQIEQIEVR